MKKGLIITGAVLGSLLLAGGTVTAAAQVIKSNAIGEKNALNFACVDAGVLPENAESVQTDFGFEKGKFVYDVDFRADGVRYEYTLDAKSGAVLERENEKLTGNLPENQGEGQKVPEEDTQAPEIKEGSVPEKKEGNGLAPGMQEGDEPAPENGSVPADEKPESGPEPRMISPEDARSSALKHAGRGESDVEFEKTKFENEEGRMVYDVEFFSADGYEYDYEIDAYTGEVLEESIELRQEADEGAEAARKAAEEAARQAREAAEEAEKQAEEAAELERKAAEEAARQAREAERQAGETAREGGIISVEEAKKAALEKAGLTEDTVVFEKAKLERENGRAVYDVEFFIEGEKAYDYEIDARTGEIVSEETEPWEAED